MSSIEEVLVPMYLLHRYQIEAASKVLGGIEYNYALKGDGQIVTALIPFDQQIKALKSLKFYPPKKPIVTREFN